MRNRLVVTCAIAALLIPAFAWAQTTGCDASQTCGQQMLDKLEAIRTVLMESTVVLSIALGIIAGRLR